jgi:signal transduction histidine kinase
VTLIVFSVALYLPFSGHLSRQLDTELRTLARLAAPSFIRARSGQSLESERGDESPWREFFDPERQSLEWFDREGKLLAARGERIRLGFSPVADGGYWTLRGKPALDRYRIRTFTLQVNIDRSSLDEPPLSGFVRVGETTEKLQEMQGQFLGQFIVSIIVALGAVGIGGLWLTRKALEAVEHSFQRLKQFTADASHELRNPLAALQTSLDVMRAHPERFHEKDFKKLNAIASATEQMTELTRDLLFLARMEGEKPASANDRERQNIDLSNLLEDAIEWLEPVAEAKQIRLEYECPPGVYLWGNPSQLSRLFGNLLENALQYTPPRGFVHLRLSRDNQGAIVTVEDTGIGIAPEHLRKVFERFWRADRARDYREGGTGLGLAIALAVARQHGGQIQVTSREGIGSCFQVSLPLHYSPRGSAASRFVSRLLFAGAPLSPGLLPIDLLARARSSWRQLGTGVLIGLLCLFPPWMAWETFGRTSIFNGVYFPGGESSFADEIVADPGAGTVDPGAALGIPETWRSSPWTLIPSRPNYATLPPGGRITVRFTDNVLTGSGDSRPDLQIFYKGAPERILVEASTDRRLWRSLGTIVLGNGAIDIDRAGWGKGDFSAYVRLVYPFSEEANAPVYLDSIGAISSVSLVRGIWESWFLSRSFAALVAVVLFGVLGIYWGKYRFKSAALK